MLIAKFNGMAWRAHKYVNCDVSTVLLYQEFVVAANAGGAETRLALALVIASHGRQPRAWAVLVERGMARYSMTWCGKMA